MPRKKSLILFGEGKTDAVFLRHLVSLYQSEIDSRVKVEAGQGGSPKEVANRLIKKHLQIGAFDGSLLLLDEDLSTEEIPEGWLRRHRIQLVVSEPCCLEGLLLTMLDDPPLKRDRPTSRGWKRHFQRKYLGTDRDSEVVAKFRAKCPDLFPKGLLDGFRDRDGPVAEILKFLGL